LCGVALTDGGKLAQLRIRVVTLGDLKQPRATPFYDHRPLSTPVLDFGACSWVSQINRYDYSGGPKEIDEKLMRSVPELARDLCIRNVELRLKRRRAESEILHNGPQLYELNAGWICT
jgi:hypothetical protein